MTTRRSGNESGDLFQHRIHPQPALAHSTAPKVPERYDKHLLDGVLAAPEQLENGYPLDSTQPEPLDRARGACCGRTYLLNWRAESPQSAPWLPQIAEEK